ncbi:hypothetical protein JW992_02245 [candidate division KSB1 bacterium]|nr:hypothetical protein [candidate division KSB1 bacterium]
MKRCFVRVVMVLLASVAVLYAEPNLLHMPPPQIFSGHDAKLQFTVEPLGTRLIFAQLYYRRAGDNNFQEIPFSPQGNGWAALIPAGDVTGVGVEYFISALLIDDIVLTYPVYNPYKEPQRLDVLPAPVKPEIQQVKSAAAMPTSMVEPEKTAEPAIAATPADSIDWPQTDDEIIILSPDDHAAMPAADLLFAASINRDEPIDSNNVKLFLDGQEISDGLEISEYIVSYVPKSIPAGNHWFKLVLQRSAQPSLSRVVHFSVQSEEKPLSIPATFSSSFFAEARSEEISNREESFAFAGGRFDGQTGSLSYSGRLLFTSLEKSTFQPRNRYTFSVGTKWLGLSAGDTYPRYNDLILWGKRVRGVSGYLRLGFFNLEATYGEIRRAVQGDSLQLRRGTFGRKTLAIRPSFGSGQKFQLGLTLVKTRDDTSSITYGQNPHDNLVFGPDLRLSFDRGRFVLTASGAMSLSTRNIQGGAIDAEQISEALGQKVDLPVDPQDLSRYLIINDSTFPIDPRGGSSVAWDVSLRLNYYRNLLRIGYKSIGSEYLSLTNDWIRTDVQGLYFSDRMRLFSNKLYLTLGYENYQDNYSRQDANPSVDLKTFNYSLSWFPGSGLPHVTASLRTHYRDNGLPEDSLTTINRNLGSDGDSTYVLDYRDNQLHRDLSLTIGYDLNIWERDHTLQFSLLTYNMQDRYKPTRPAGYSSLEFSSNLWMVSWTSNIRQDLRTSWQFASTRNQTGEDSDYRYRIIGGLAEWELNQRRFGALAEIRHTTMENRYLTVIENDNSAEVSADVFRTLFRFGGWYQIRSGMRLTLDANFFSIKQKNDFYPTPKGYTDRIIRLRYEKLY